MRVVLGLIIAMVSATAYASPPGETDAMFTQLSKVRLNQKQIYLIRDIAIRRDVLAISFTRGAIAFLEPVNGRITGAVFVGDGDIVAIPPGSTEKQQLYRFTGSPLLTEHFDAAIFRFTDDTGEEILKAYQEHAQEDVSSDDRADVQSLEDEVDRRSAAVNHRIASDLLGRSDLPFFLAQFRNEPRGWFNGAYDRRRDEEIVIGTGDGPEPDTVWSSFNRRNSVVASDTTPVEVLSYEIDSTIGADMRLAGKASVRLRARTEGDRTLDFSLSPLLHVTSVGFETGVALDYHQQTARVNHLLVVLPEKIVAQQEMTIQIAYAGEGIEVLNGASHGVSRKLWYPALDSHDRADFDMTFHFPPSVNLVATGSKVKEWDEAGRRHSNWKSDTEIFDAGFEIGTCSIHSDETGAIALHTCLNNDPNVFFREILAYRASPRPLNVDLPSFGQGVLGQARLATDYFGGVLGDFPFRTLSISPHPAAAAQSGPSLIYASMLPFLTTDQRTNFGLAAGVDYLQAERQFVREVARQWFGDSVSPAGYHDDWIVEGLSGYGAAMYLQQKYSDAQFKGLLATARSQLLEKSPEAVSYDSLGPVSLGFRMTQSRTTDAYLSADDNKSMWVMHMLRMLMRRGKDDDSSFLQMIRGVTDEFRGRSIATSDFKRIVEKYGGAALDVEKDGTADWFFDDWVFGAGIPTYAVDYTVEPVPDGFRVTGRISQSGVSDGFIMPVPVYADEEFLGRVTVSVDEGTFDFVVKRRPEQIRIDPDATILALTP